MKQTSNEQAEAIVAKATELGWTVSVSGAILRISKAFTPGDLDQFNKADSEWYRIISLLKTTRPGSNWGTDSSGVGGYVAHKNGFFEMNRSGGDKRVLNQLVKMGY